MLIINYKINFFNKKIEKLNIIIIYKKKLKIVTI